MKLTGFELKKLFGKRLFSICLLLFFAANIAVLLYARSNNLEASVISSNLSEYERVISDLDSLTNEQADARLRGMLKATEIALELDSLADAENTDDLQRAEDFLNRYKEESPKEYEQALSLSLSRQELLDRQTYLSTLVRQSAYISSYGGFIGTMEQRAENRLKFSIFAEKGSFSHNNIQKTAEDFKRLEDAELKIGNNLAVENATTFELTDLLVFALVFLMCFYLFAAERDRALYSLIKATKNGRMPLIISKLTALVLLTVLISAEFYSSNIIACGLYSGFGDMTRSIQSCEAFMNCNLRMQIWQYLILWCAAKALIMCVIAVLLAVIFILVKNTAMISAAAALAAFAEVLLALSAEGNSAVGAVKYLNLYYILSGNNAFGNYLNVNLFSKPVNISLICIIVLPLIFTASVFAACLLFVNAAQASKRTGAFVLLDRAVAKFGRIRGSVSVFRGECFKHYKSSMAMLVVLLLGFFAFSSLSADISISFVSGEESAYNAYMNKLEGALTPEKEEYLSEQQAYFDGLNDELARTESDNSLTAEEKGIKAAAIEAILETKGSAFSRVAAQSEYIKGVGVEYGVEPVFINESVYKRLAANPAREWQYFALTAASIIFAASNLFAFEHKKQMTNLLTCTKGGKLKLAGLKLLTALLTTVISYVLVYLPYCINFIKTFGPASFDSPIIFIQDFSGVNSTITVGEMLAYESAAHIMFFVTATMLVAMLSQLVKNNILAIIISAAAIIFPCLLCMNASDLRLFALFQSGGWKAILPMIMLLMIVLCAVFFAVTVKSFCKIMLRKGNSHAGT